MLWGQRGSYKLDRYQTEAELEQGIAEVKHVLFGPKRIYFDTKRRIGAQKQNIPDGYLLDLSSPKKPQLYVVEVELASHHPLKHIAVQILEFNLAFESDPQKVKKVLREAIEQEPLAREKCETYAKAFGLDNMDLLLEKLVYDSPFGALVIIDELEDNLSNVLAKKFNFVVETLTLRRYCNAQGERLYDFEPFLEDIEEIAPQVSGPVATGELDTIVVPAQEEGFKEVFLGEDRWYQIRVHPSMLHNLKYIASYVTAPTSAITHFAEIASIEPWRESGKYVVNFKGKAQPLQKPIPLVKQGKVTAPQGHRYTTFEKLTQARSLDDVF